MNVRVKFSRIKSVFNGSNENIEIKQTLPIVTNWSLRNDVFTPSQLI